MSSKKEKKVPGYLKGTALSAGRKVKKDGKDAKDKKEKPKRKATHSTKKRLKALVKGDDPLKPKAGEKKGKAKKGDKAKRGDKAKKGDKANSTAKGEESKPEKVKAKSSRPPSKAPKNIQTIPDEVITDDVVRTPMFRWGQDKARVFLTIDLYGVGNTGKVVIEADKFSFSAKHHGATYSLEFDFTFPIKKDESSFAVRPRNVEVLLVKQDQTTGHWPSLMKDKAKFKVQCGIDWDKCTEEDEDVGNLAKGLESFGLGGDVASDQDAAEEADAEEEADEDEDSDSSSEEDDEFYAAAAVAAQARMAQAQEHLNQLQTGDDAVAIAAAKLKLEEYTSLANVAQALGADSDDDE